MLGMHLKLQLHLMAGILQKYINMEEKQQQP